MLQVRGLHAFYGSSQVLRGVDFDVRPGEIVALLGRNGSGRSTTAKAVMGLVQARGTVQWQGQDLLGLPPHAIARRGVGYVPESRDVFPGLTVHQNLLLGRKPGQRQARWQAEGLSSQPVGEQGLLLARPMPVQAVPGFDEGLCSVQDAAAQCAAPLLLNGLARPEGRGLRVLDACAAPGGKTAHLLERLQDHDSVLALDVDAQRCARIHDNLHRLQLQAEVRAADAAEVESWWDGQAFDAILLDAPCTASGIVRRHPDVRWLRRPTDSAQLAKIQAQLLQTLWPLLADGGKLLYCTCSVFKAEGEQQITAFVAHNTDAVLRPAPGHLLPQTAGAGGGVPDNLPGDHDGFYYALLEKRLAPQP